jgi:LuxR family maltose regulon positive regulatory protein
MQGLEDLARAEYAYFAAIPAKAESHALRSIAQARNHGQSEIEIRALYILVRTYLQMGKHELIMDVLAQMDRLLAKANVPNLHLFYEIVTSWFYASIGEVRRVDSWLKSDLWSSGLSEHIDGLDDFAKIKYYLAVKDYDALLDFTEQRSQCFGIARFIVGRVGLMATQAVCHQRLKEKDAALDCLRRAYELALPNQLYMPFIELGNNMRSLASLALRTPTPKLSARVPVKWLESIRSRAATYAKRVAFVRSRYLQATQPSANINITAKEAEILEDLAHGLSRTEISLARGVSVNTVKTMLQMLYDKLGAEGAIDAVRIATSKKLI